MHCERLAVFRMRLDGTVTAAEYKRTSKYYTFIESRMVDVWRLDDRRCCKRGFPHQHSQCMVARIRIRARTRTIPLHPILYCLLHFRLFFYFIFIIFFPFVLLAFLCIFSNVSCYYLLLVLAGSDCTNPRMNNLWLVVLVVQQQF